MNSFVNYIFESGISLGIFSLIYFLLLRNETFFKLNRFFLLAAILFSGILPFLHFRIFPGNSIMLEEVTVFPYSNLLESISVYGNSVSGSIVQMLTASQWIGLIYLAGVLFFVIRFVIRITQIQMIIKRGKKVKSQDIHYIIVSRKIIPFSFLKYVFVSDDFKSRSGWEKMIVHEMEHVRQGHSVDVLILEILSIFQWYNPFFWLLRRALKENHEFLADKAVIKSSGEVKDYKKLLLEQLVGEQFVIANNFNYSLIKKRMKMMTKIKSSKIATAKLLSGVLIAVALIVVFACEKKDNVIDDKALSDEIQLKSSNTGEPLILIDGEIASKDAMEKLNPGSIHSISVFKEQDSEIIKEYGEFAQNGVIDISLKSAVSKDENDVEEVVVVGYGEEAQVYTGDVYNLVEEMPEYPGGELELRKYIARLVKYPVSAAENGIQGKVFVSFVVEKDGSVGRTRVARGVDPYLDVEALRVVKSMPAWKPGKHKGKAVAVSYTVPINFLLE